MINLVRTNSDNADFRELIHLLDADLRIRDGDEHSFYAQFNKVDTIRHVIVAYDDAKAVGCGAFKEYEANAAEIKRMYVREDERGKGIAGKILTKLENWAKESGFTECVLETGLKQPEAIALYRKSGYELIPNYGQYAGVENSVCMTIPLPKVLIPI
jgi:GNAT superfamily N-acetyltransferase